MWIPGGGGPSGAFAVVKRLVESFDCPVLDAESDVGVDLGGDTYVGVAEEFLDHDEFDALFQEKGRRRAPQILEADAAERGPAEQVLKCRLRVAPSTGLPSGRVKT